ncbi:MAG: thermitase [Solirubrobacteraceae bacterium]|nr:thermitase [Solirubrobacteraceae bacterium]
MSRVIRTAVVAAFAVLVLAPAAGAARYVHNQVIVKYAAGASSAQRSVAAKAAGATATINRVAATGASVLRVAGDAKAAAAKLNRSPNVLYAEPDYILKATSVPNDPLFSQLYGINNPNDADLDGPEGWDLAFGAGVFPRTGVKVGIVDTGIDQAHQDLAGKTFACAGVQSFGIGGLIGGNSTIVANKCNDDNNHGTHVAGTIGAIANNGIGVAGVAPPAQIASCKALSSGGSGSTTGVANCITWAKNQGVKVISMSLGGGSSTTMQSAVQNAYANGNGALIVAAAGNDGNSTLNYPAAYAEVVSVAASDSNDQHASFSNVNSDVEVDAAGVNVLSTKPGNQYQQLSGTSMATPHAAGVAAMIAYRFPTLNAAGIRSRLDAGVDDKGAPGRDSTFGFGRVNLVKALQ